MLRHVLISEFRDSCHPSDTMHFNVLLMHACRTGKVATICISFLVYSKPWNGGSFARLDAALPSSKPTGTTNGGFRNMGLLRFLYGQMRRNCVGAAMRIVSTPCGFGALRLPRGRHTSLCELRGSGAVQLGCLLKARV